MHLKEMEHFNYLKLEKKNQLIWSEIVKETILTM